MICRNYTAAGSILSVFPVPEAGAPGSILPERAGKKRDVEIDIAQGTNHGAKGEKPTIREPTNFL